MFCTRHWTYLLASLKDACTLWNVESIRAVNAVRNWISVYSIKRVENTICVHSVRVVVVCIFYRIFLFLSSLNLGFDVCKWLTLYVIRDKFQTGVYEKILHPFIPFHRREFYKGLLLCLFSQWLCVMCGFVCVCYTHTHTL